MDMSDNSSTGSQLVRRLVALVTDDKSVYSDLRFEGHSNVFLQSAWKLIYSTMTNPFCMVIKL